MLYAVFCCIAIKKQRKSEKEDNNEREGYERGIESTELLTDLHLNPSRFRKLTRIDSSRNIHENDDNPAHEAHPYQPQHEATCWHTSITADMRRSSRFADTAENTRQSRLRSIAAHMKPNPRRSIRADMLPSRRRIFQTRTMIFMMTLTFMMTITATSATMTAR